MSKREEKRRSMACGIILLFFLLNPADGLSQVSFSGGARLSGRVGTGGVTTFWADGCESGDLAGTWEAGGNGFVWDDAFGWYWHCDTNNVKTGAYSMEAHYQHNPTLSSPLTAPILGDVACGGSGGDRFAKIVIVRPNLTTGIINAFYAAEANRTVASGRCLTVQSPSASDAVSFYTVYAGTATGDSNLKLQNASPIGVGTNWTEPDGGLVNNGNYPASFSPDGTSLTRQFIRWPNVPDGIGIHIFKSFWLYLATPDAGGSKTIQRKLTRSTNQQSSGDTCPAPSCWEGILTSEDTDGTGSALIYGNQGDGCSQQNAFNTSPNKLSYDTWYHIQLEEKLNDPPASSNAEIRLWVTPDGGSTTLWGENTAFRVRCSADEPMGMVDFGNQTNLGAGEIGNEVRNFDDIKVTSGYVAP